MQLFEAPAPKQLCIASSIPLTWLQEYKLLKSPITLHLLLYLDIKALQWSTCKIYALYIWVQEKYHSGQHSACIPWNSGMGLTTLDCQIRWCVHPNSHLGINKRPMHYINPMKALMFITNHSFWNIPACELNVCPFIVTKVPGAL